MVKEKRCNGFWSLLILGSLLNLWLVVGGPVDVVAIQINQEVKPMEIHPLLKNNTGKTVIRKWVGDSTFIIIAKDGRVIVADPYKMPAEITSGVDIVTVTHTHNDHNDIVFYSRLNCRKSIAAVEEFTEKNVQVISLASSHSDNLINPEQPTNVIYIFQVDGLRIAHLGDIGQDKLTETQLNQLRTVDLLFLQISNSYSNYPDDGSKAIAIVQQIQPRIIIPTHCFTSPGFAFNQAGLANVSAAAGGMERLPQLVISADEAKNIKSKLVRLDCYVF